MAASDNAQRLIDRTDGVGLDEYGVRLLILELKAEGAE
jgi:hypothetical protein